ncbi:MAG: hypothetical protein QOE97_1402 [Pseudonocardiales bacterium]|jgi:hypothetical protein|nr:hypothetical protein [Pseudonocardiales bacterium]
MAGNAVLVVQVEIDPVDEEEFNRWYDEEHIPEKLEEPGFISVRRFKISDGACKYLVLYELENAADATKPAYMRKEPTEWGKSIMARWKDWNRNVWIDVKSL